MYPIPIIFVPAKRVHVLPHQFTSSISPIESSDNINSMNVFQTTIPPVIVENKKFSDVLFTPPVIQRARPRPYRMISGAIIAAKTSM